MLRMFKIPPTRFETTLELQPLIPIVERLRDKQAKLLKTDAEKQTIVSYLLARIEEAIDAYNSNPYAAPTHHGTIKEMLQLLTAFKAILAEAYQHDVETLSAHRNHNKEIAVGGAIAAPVALSGAVLFGVLTGPIGLGTLALTAFASGYYLSSTSLQADTIQILKELNEKTVSISESLDHISCKYRCS